MTNWIFRLLFPFAASAFSSAACATSHYVCDCATGANSACVAGSDSNTGTSIGSPWQTINKAATNINNMVAGDQLLFCRGGAWASQATTLSWFSATGTAEQSNPMILDGYTASWGGAARPILRFSGTALYFGTYTKIIGVTVRNLDLRGPDILEDTVGLYVYAGASYLVFDNLNIQGFHLGFSSAQDGLPTAGRSHDITVRNSSFLNLRDGGAFIATANTVLENNTFTNNGNCAGGFDDGHDDGSSLHRCHVANQRHSIYVGGAADGSTKNIVIRGNTSTKVSYFTGSCEGAHIIGHGIINGMLVENNLVYETSASGGCYGIGYGDSYGQRDEGMTNAVYRGNTIANVGGAYLGAISSPGTIFENNVLIINNSASATALNTQSRNLSTSLATSAVIFRNNSIYYGSGTSGTAIGINATGTGTDNIVSNNLVYIAAGSSTSCWDTGTKPASDFTSFDYNLCYNLGTGGNTPPGGLNTHGLTSNPQLVAGAATPPAWTMAIQATSPARGITGNNALCAITDRTGRTRGTQCDVGAYKYFGANTVPPAAPLSVIVR